MKYHLYTDGACQPNPGQGGWAFILFSKDNPQKRHVHSGYVENTTNNRMELLAVLEGFKYLANIDSNADVVLHSDSKYIINGIKAWMHGWARRGWIKKDKKPVLNDDIWRQLHSIYNELTINCEHVKGHSGQSENEECDRLAVKEIHNAKT